MWLFLLAQTIWTHFNTVHFDMVHLDDSYVVINLWFSALASHWLLLR